MSIGRENGDVMFSKLNRVPLTYIAWKIVKFREDRL